MAPTPLLTLSLRKALGCYLLLAVPLVWLGIVTTDVFRMEGLIANGAASMQSWEDACVPKVYGEIYAYKPPLAYWLAKGSFAGFDSIDRWSLRLPFGLCALLLGGAVLGLLARVAGTRAGLWAALATVSGFLLTSKLGMATFDVPLALGVGVATTAATVNLTREKPGLGLWMLAYFGLGIGFLAKGPIALALFVPGLVLAGWVAARGRGLLAWPHGSGVALFAAMIGAWTVCALRHHGAESFDQASTEASLRLFDYRFPHNLQQPLRPLQAIVFFFPWSLFVLLGLTGWRGTQAFPTPRVLRIACAFLGGNALFLFVIATFEPRYYLPLAAPVGVVSGLTIERYLQAGSAWTARWSQGLRWATPLMGLGLLGCALQTAVPLGWIARAALGSLGLVGCLAGSKRWFQSTTPEGAVVWRSLVLACLLAGLQLGFLRPQKAYTRSGRGLAQAVDEVLPPGAEVWTDTKDGHSSLFFYLGHPVRTFERAGAPPSDVWVLLDAQAAEAAKWPSKTIGTFPVQGRTFVLRKSL